MLLAGDIGGTKTSLAIYDAEHGPHHPLAEATFPSDDYDNLETIAREFLAQIDHTVEAASFGVAGPVVNGHVKTTNLPWEMDETTLREALGVRRVFLLNDLESIANAVPRLEAEDIFTLNEGQAESEGAIGVIAPGTGLGEGFLVWDGQHYRANPSEGGHTDFGPATPTQTELLRYWQAKKGHVSYEWVCSGIGIAHIYEFFKASGHAPEPAWLTEKLAATDDPTPVIVHSALHKDEPLCRATLDTFIEILGAEAGNLALKILATGGIYLGGGIPPRILSKLEEPAFLNALRQKGRFQAMLTNFPVYVILNAQAGLIGAAAFGFDHSPA